MAEGTLAGDVKSSFRGHLHQFKGSLRVSSAITWERVGVLGLVGAVVWWCWGGVHGGGDDTGGFNVITEILFFSIFFLV